MKKLLNPADGIKDLMWSHLMTGGQKADITGLKESVYRLIQMATQKNSGQRGSRIKNIPWETLDMEMMMIVCEATALVLSGVLDNLEDEEGS